MIFYEYSDYINNIEPVFNELKEKLQGYLPEARIEHIGASSLRGAVSKGDLDIFIGVDRNSFSEAIDCLIQNGFKEKEDTFRCDELRMLVLSDQSIDIAVQVVVKASEFEKFITFRDILSSNNSLLERYNKLKRDSSGLEESVYRARKSEFIEGVLNGKFH